MGSSNGWLVGPKDYKKQNSRTRPKTTPTKQTKDRIIKIRRGNFKAVYIKASDLK